MTPPAEFGRHGYTSETSGRLDAPAFHRNCRPILDVLRRLIMPETRNLLEVAAGTGQHAAFLAPHFPQVTWWPSDVDDAELRSIDAWCEGIPSIERATRLDAGSDAWCRNTEQMGVPARLDAVLCVNLLHISPWQVTQRLLEGVGKRLEPHGFVFIYGPFRRDGAHTADSNARFDASLRASDSRWGVRDIADVAACADSAGLRLAEIVEMPANNLSLILRSRSGDGAAT